MDLTDYMIVPVAEQDDDLIEDKLDQYNNHIAPPLPGVKEEGFTRKITDRDGKIIGGCCAMVHRWGFLFVDVLWVDERYRKMGLGSALLQDVERIGKAKGCFRASLTTTDYQGRYFYPKHGYRLCGETEDCPKGHSDFLFSKLLDDGAPYVPSHGPMDKALEIVDGTEEDGEYICDKIGEYNAAIVPKAHEYQDVSRKVLGDDGKLIAAIFAGNGVRNAAIVDKIWVEEPYRTRGLGSKLLEEVEQDVKSKGATMMIVSVYDWNMDFFVRHGYYVIHTIEDIPKGHNYYTVRKDL